MTSTRRRLCFEMKILLPHNVNKFNSKLSQLGGVSHHICMQTGNPQTIHLITKKFRNGKGDRLMHFIDMPLPNF